jgi:hypothetical protein
MSGNAVVFGTQPIVGHIRVSVRDVPAVVPANDDPARSIGTIEETDDRPGVTEQLADRFAAARARLAQLTFYLLDPDSWR